MDRNGENIKVYKDVVLKDNTLHNDISIGDFSIVRYSELFDGVEIGRRNTVDSSIIEKNTYTGEFCMIKYAEIGKYCAVSWNVTIGGANHDIHKLSLTPLSRIFDDEKLKYDSFINEKVKIGNDVWIGAGAHVLRGVTVGDGAVIAANAVVTHDVEPYSIAAGVPAKTIGYRFSKDIIKRLLNLKWWNWSEKNIKSAKDCFKSDLDNGVLERLELINGEE